MKLKKIRFQCVFFFGVAQFQYLHFGWFISPCLPPKKTYYLVNPNTNEQTWIYTHTCILITTPPHPYIGPPKIPPVFFFVLQKKRSLAASVPKISGGKVQRWSQASSMGYRCGWRLVALLNGFPRKTTWEVLLWRNVWLAKKEVSQVSFFFFGVAEISFLVENHLEEDVCSPELEYLSFFWRVCRIWGKDTSPKTWHEQKTHNSSIYGTHFTQKTSWNSSMEMLPDSSGSQ